jgi:hypothetical protein
MGPDFERVVAAKLRALVEAGELRAIAIAVERLWPRQELFSSDGGAGECATMSAADLSERIERLFRARKGPGQPSTSSPAEQGAQGRTPANS